MAGKIERKIRRVRKKYPGLIRTIKMAIFIGIFGVIVLKIVLRLGG